MIRNILKQLLAGSLFSFLRKARNAGTPLTLTASHQAGWKAGWFRKF